MTRATSAPARGPGAAEWVRRRERGSIWLMRLMTAFSLAVGRRVGRVVLHVIAAYFFLFAPRSRRASLLYLQRALGRRPTARDRFRQVMAFATTIHDRVYLLNDRFELFDITVVGEELMLERMRAGRGAFLVGAHFGSFEVTRTMGRRQPDLRVAMVAYVANARKINAMVAAINPALADDTVGLGNLDAMLKVRGLLDEGVFVGMLGDRTPGEEATEVVEFLGAPARFPLGPMRLAALLGRRAILMVGVYCGGNRYRVVFEEIADFSGIRREERESAIRAGVARYAARLESYCREYPYNWFNFFDFWAET
ncbi:MAG: acyl-CoA synthetase [Steroidobacteraceae bacterium]